jgi:hypothetical protein
MTNLQVGVLVAGAAVAVFAIAAAILAGLERTPGLRGTAHVPGSPSRAVAVAEITVGVALLAVSVSELSARQPAGTILIAAGGAAGLLVHAGSAFIVGEPTRRRVGYLGEGLLALSLLVGAYVLGRH